MYLPCILPRHPSEPLNCQRTERGEHGPPPMDQLALPKPLQPENLRVGLKRSRLHIRALEPGPDQLTRLVLRQVLIQRVQVELQVLGGFAQPERVEPVVPNQAPVQPLGRLRARVPERPVRTPFGRGLLRDRFLPEPEPGLESPAVHVAFLERGSEERGSCCSSSGAGHH